MSYFMILMKKVNFDVNFIGKFGKIVWCISLLCVCVFFLMVSLVSEVNEMFFLVLYGEMI